MTTVCVFGGTGFLGRRLVERLAARGTAGQTYELAGPGVHTPRELVSFALRLIDKRRLLVPLPFAVAEIQALEDIVPTYIGRLRTPGPD